MRINTVVEGDYDLEIEPEMVLVNVARQILHGEAVDEDNLELLEEVGLLDDLIATVESQRSASTTAQESCESQ